MNEITSYISYGNITNFFIWGIVISSLKYMFNDIVKQIYLALRITISRQDKEGQHIKIIKYDKPEKVIVSHFRLNPFVEKTGVYVLHQRGDGAFEVECIDFAVWDKISTRRKVEKGLLLERIKYVQENGTKNGFRQWYNKERKKNDAKKIKKTRCE